MTLPRPKRHVEIDILGLQGSRRGEVPADIRGWRSAPVQTIVVYTKAIEVNVPIDDAIFSRRAPPAGPAPGPPRGAGGSTR